MQVESDDPGGAEQLDPGLARALQSVGDRWSLRLVAALLAGPLRFTDLRQRLPAIASNVLAERLRRLESSGVIIGETYSERPPRAEYRLTRTGRELGSVIAALSSWGGSESSAPVHGRCGSRMESRWYCPTCQEMGQPLAGEDEMEPDDVVYT